MTSTGIEVRLLGPVEVTKDGVPVRLRKRLLTVFTLVVLTPDSVMSFARLDELLAPGRGLDASTYRKYVSELRQILGKFVIPQWAPDKIKVDLDPSQIDVRLFREHREAAQSLPAEQRLQTLLRAQDLWRERDPLGGLDDELFEDERRQLRNERRALFADVINIALTSNETDIATRESGSAVEIFPEDDSLRILKLRALGKAGRITEMDLEFKQLAETARKNGQTVSNELTKQFLNLKETVKSEQNRNGIRTPSQLGPPLLTTVRGRENEQLHLNDLLEPDATGPHFAYIVGLPGSGKTTLAVSWLRDNWKKFPDGVIYRNLHGFSDQHPKKTENLLHEFIRDLQEDPRGHDGHRLIALYQSILADRKVLLVLDNARDFTQIADLLPSGPACRTLVTSRSTLVLPRDENLIREVRLGPVSETEALEILTDSIGKGRVENDLGNARKLVVRAGRLPLAIQIIARKASARSEHRLATLLSELDSPTALLDMNGPESSNGLRNVISWSYRQLDASAARVLCLMSLYPGTSVTSEVLVYLSGAPRTEISAALDQLAESSLVQAVPDDRFRMHDSIREFATEAALRTLTLEESAVVRERILKYLLWTGSTCDARLGSGRQVPAERPDEAIPEPPLASGEDATRWFKSEYAAFSEALTSDDFATFPSYRWLIPMVLVTFQNRSGHWLDARDFLRAAIDFINKENRPDPRVKITSTRLLGIIQRKLGYHELAAQQLLISINLASASKAELDEAHAHQVLSVVHEDGQQWQKATDHAKRALDIYTKHNDHRGITHATITLSSCDLAIRSPHEALERASKVLRLIEASSDEYGQGALHRTLMTIHLHLRGYVDAIEHGEAAADLYRRLEAPANEAHVLAELGQALLIPEAPEGARMALSRAKEIFEGLSNLRPIDKVKLADVKAALLHLKKNQSSGGSPASGTSDSGV